MNKLKSVGRCVYCGQFYDKRGIGKHLDTHLTQQPTAPTAKAFHVRVEAAEMFLELLIDARTTLSNVDGYLRKIWLECCGHLSAFRPQGSYEEIAMTRKVGAFFSTGLVLNYEYDFGSTTVLRVKVGKTFSIPVNKGIELLSRNEPLDIRCDACHQQPATQICTIHVYEGNGFLCDACSETHAEECEDFADYAGLPVVNSPRMGVCGYEGGTIDTGRDGVFS
ncbi:hypothetical protein ACO2Q8_24240 [Larkinella sp. VNQ87]|uniref:hypothetical protein n=1 Tax=Larkinella sp. VNQ87 TaxID=3400921 RepID=UPI003BFD701D